MKIEMCTRISGTHNGEDWPSIGEVIDLPDEEARDMIAAGLARAAETATAPEPETPEVEVEEPETATAPEPEKKRRR